MHEISIDRAIIRVGDRRLAFLHELTVAPSAAMPATINAPLFYGGYCGAPALSEVRGAIVICHGTHRPALPGAAERETTVRAAGAAGMLTIADPGFTVEPPRWPYAYARTVTLADQPAKSDPFLRMTLNAESLAKLLRAAAGAQRR